jgi:hypothetical protein
MADFASSVPKFKRALWTRLLAEARLDPTRTAIAWGNPHPQMWPPEVIIIGVASNIRWGETAGGLQARQEYDLEITVNVTGPSVNLNPDNQERAWTLMDAVHSSLRDWLQAGGPLVSGTWGQIDVVQIGDARDREGLDDTSRDASVITTVHVTARLVRYG